MLHDLINEQGNYLDERDEISEEILFFLYIVP